MNDHAKAAHIVRHPRYIHTAFQSYLKSQGLRAPLRKAYAAWLSRYMVFHHGQPLERLTPHHVEHYLGFLATYADFSQPQLHEAHCCLRLFYHCFLPTLDKLAQGDSMRPLSCEACGGSTDANRRSERL